MARFIDMTGQRFGKLVALSYDKNEQKWLCQCDCGNQKLIRRRNFANGPTRSCGCMARKSEKRIKDLTGQKFGRITVMHRVASDSNRAIWWGKCDCGKEKEYKSRELVSGNTRSCGCLKRDLTIERGTEQMLEASQDKKVDGVALHLFTDKARKHSSTGYRGVHKYYTQKSKELRYRAWITVDGKRYYKAGFLTPEDAYYNGRLMLEQKYLPKGGETDA